MKTKICSLCKDELPANEKYFHRTKATKSGIKGKCKICESFIIKEWIKKRYKAKKGFKICVNCGEEYPIDDFYFGKSKNMPTGFHYTCRKCSNGWIEWPKKPKNGNKICLGCKIEYPNTNEYFRHCKYNNDGFAHKCKCCKNGWDKWPEKTRKGFRVCSKCKKELPENKKNFHVRTEGTFYSSCINCVNEYWDSFALFDSKLFSQIKKYEDTKKDDFGFGMVKCIYCNRWFNPIKKDITSRTNAIKGAEYISNGTENRFYCSDECKENCPIYCKILHSGDFKINTSREVPSWLRYKCFELDEYECQRCGNTSDLQCHHILGYTQNPQLGCDICLLITFCKKCHNWIHHQKGCTYKDLQCKI